MDAELKQKLKNTLTELSKIEKFIDDNKTNELSSFLIRYAIIKATSTIEKVYKAILFNYIASDTNSYAQNFLQEKIIRDSANPRYDTIYKNLKICDETLANNINSYFKNSSHKTNLDSLVKYRNGIAHGEDIAVDLTIGTIITFYKSSIKIILYIDLIFKKNR